MVTLIPSSIQLRDHLRIAIVTALDQLAGQLVQHRRIRRDAVPEDVQRAPRHGAVGTDLDARQEVEPRRPRRRRGFGDAGDRVVVGQRQCTQPATHRELHHLRRRERAVGGGGMAMEIDRRGSHASYGNAEVRTQNAERRQEAMCVRRSSLSDRRFASPLTPTGTRPCLGIPKSASPIPRPTACRSRSGSPASRALRTDHRRR